MSNDDLLRELVEANGKRTPGEWFTDAGEGRIGYVYCDDSTGSAVALCAFENLLRSEQRFVENAAFIAACTRAMPAIVEMMAENERLRAELAECRRDAERYRWLRGERAVMPPQQAYPSLPWPVRIELDPWPTSKACYGATLDSAIDAAMQKENTNG